MKNQALRHAAVALLGFGSLAAGRVLAAGVAVNPDGITFPDGSVQETAAVPAPGAIRRDAGEVRILNTTEPGWEPATPTGRATIVSNGTA